MKGLMKKTLTLSALCSALALLYPISAQSQPPGRVYFRAEAGGEIVQDTDLKEFFGPVAPGSKVKFDPGGRFAFSGGYFFTDWFALEGEVGGMFNSIKEITDASAVDAYFYNIPFMVNVRFEMPPTRSKLTPFCGGGIGVSAAVLDIDHIDHVNAFVTGSESEAVFAYQAFAGLRYALSYNMGLRLEYHFFGTDEPHWHGDVPGSIKFGSIETHALSIAFDMHF
jgi:opacity protein-like surface antigen